MVVDGSMVDFHGRHGVTQYVLTLMHLVRLVIPSFCIVIIRRIIQYFFDLTPDYHVL